MGCSSATQRRPLVSIIMAAYNAEKTIKQAIFSVIRQTFTNWELIIVNDCSKDSTLLIVSDLSKNDARIRLLNNESNLGVSITRKIGMEASAGKWIAVLDSDDIWVEDKLEKQLSLAERKGAELLFTGSSFINDNGAYIDWILHVPETLCYRELLKQNLISNSSVLVNADLYRQHYAIGDNMHEDFAIWLSITRTGRIAYGINEPLLIYRLTKSSKSSNKIKAAIMNWNTYRYVGLSPLVAAYYMVWYVFRSLLKYRHLK